jgi:asparagine synthase (glutamine-hydrolysing)
MSVLRMARWRSGGSGSARSPSAVCGIVGVCNLHGEPVPSGLVARLTSLIAHRGPDGEGVYTDGEVGLGHRRLAIIDLSAAGNQPMANETGDVVLNYNGEIYNFQRLRVELESLGHIFHSHTDSEVVVHAYEEWGPACVEHFDGMFAFAIWDRPRRRLFLARDRFGVKPLYWYLRNGVFVFASEVKAILAHPRVSRDVCYPALNEYFTFQNVLTDATLFDGIRLLPAGCTLTLETREGAEPKIERYWDFDFAAEAADLSPEEATDQLYELFLAAVTRQLMSDVPVGSYLSGGMDSGSITAIAARGVPRLSTFTGGFDLSSASGLELAFDERAAAEEMANVLKTEHYEVVMHAGDMEWVMPELIWHLEDLRVGQCYPNYYVARLASKFVKVVLSGAGGDELFGGYPWRYFSDVRDGDRDGYLRGYYAFWQRLVPDEEKGDLFNGTVLRELGDHSAFDVFQGVFDEWPGGLDSREGYLNGSLYFELKTFLHGLLVVEDKLSMAHSLETRVPFLDNELVDFALRLPPALKVPALALAVSVDENAIGKRQLLEVDRADGKAILREAMQRVLPEAAAQRNKQGFSAPDASWFRGESIEYLNRLLRDPKARIYEFFEPAYVARILDEHTSGRINRRLLIWSLLSFEWWCRSFLESFPARTQGELYALV